jgi:hypothetical protein
MLKLLSPAILYFKNFNGAGRLPAASSNQPEASLSNAQAHAAWPASIVISLMVPVHCHARPPLLLLHQ